jgi:hypothetical protein
MPSKKYPVSSDKVSAQEPMVKEAKAQPYRHGKDHSNATQAALSIASKKHEGRSTARVLKPDAGGTIRRPSQLVLARLSKLARTQKGRIAAIEMGSQEIFVGKDVVEATLKGWKKYPGQSFYFVRIGYPAVHRHRGGLRKR